MKVGILTHYQVESHGACLQLYAMQKVLQGLGHEVVVLTYPKNFDFADNYNSNKFNISPKNIPWYIKEYLIKQGPGIVYGSYKKHKDLADFVRTTFSFSRYSDAGVDVCVVGADEVFSLEYGVNIPMYGHGVDAGAMIAYAPSFGQTDLNRIDRFHCRNLISSGLGNFAALSVRDEGSRRIVNELTGRDAEIVCDPALLYTFADEKKRVNDSSDSDYIALYSYNTYMNEQWQIDQIREFAQQRGLKVYSVGSYHKWCDKQVSCDPLELLDYFSRATYVITDTFHGTICSTIVKTPVAVYVRDSNNVKLDYLLEQLGLTDRKAGKDKSLQNIFAKPEEFSKVDERVAKLRSRSMEYLRSALCNGEQ